MINIPEIIRHYAPIALPILLREAARHHIGHDGDAIAAVANPVTNDRTNIIRNWLNAYSAFHRYATTIQRDEISIALLTWADQDAPNRGEALNISVLTAEQIIEKHRELVAICRGIANKKLISLASKFLWLCYPHDIPIYDSQAKQALYIIGKLEVIPLKDNFAQMEKYEQFVFVWRYLYDRYENHIPEHPEYRYRIRIFDKILWIIGKDSYNSTGL